MSRTHEELRAIEDYQADFDTKVSEHDFEGAEALIDSMGEQGYETEAMILHRALNRAETEYAESYAGQKEYHNARWPSRPN